MSLLLGKLQALIINPRIESKDEGLVMGRGNLALVSQGQASPLRVKTFFGLM
jgi:hypothetical protein